MRHVIRIVLFALLALLSLMDSHTKRLVAQTSPETEEESLTTFIPSEKLPADSAISFPVDI